MTPLAPFFTNSIRWLVPTLLAGGAALEEEPRFLPAIEEVLHLPPDPGYVDYLAAKLEPFASKKSALFRELRSAAAGEAYTGQLAIGAIWGGFALLLSAWALDRRLMRKG